MNNKWYQCEECGITIKQEKTPSRSGCSKKSSHSWAKLGEVGDKNYSCKHCGTVVQTDSTPSRYGCINSSSHLWSKL